MEPNCISTDESFFQIAEDLSLMQDTGKRNLSYCTISFLAQHRMESLTQYVSRENENIEAVRQGHEPCGNDMTELPHMQRTHYGNQNIRKPEEIPALTITNHSDLMYTQEIPIIGGSKYQKVCGPRMNLNVTQNRSYIRGQSSNEDDNVMAEQVSGKIFLPRLLLVKVLDSLFDSGLEVQQVLACELCKVLTDELNALAAVTKVSGKVFGKKSGSNRLDNGKTLERSQSFSQLSGTKGEGYLRTLPGTTITRRKALWIKGLSKSERQEWELVTAAKCRVGRPRLKDSNTQHVNTSVSPSSSSSGTSSPSSLSASSALSPAESSTPESSGSEAAPQTNQKNFSEPSKSLKRSSKRFPQTRPIAGGTCRVGSADAVPIEVDTKPSSSNGEEFLSLYFKTSFVSPGSLQSANIAPSATFSATCPLPLSSPRVESRNSTATTVCRQNWQARRGGGRRARRRGVSDACDRTEAAWPLVGVNTASAKDLLRNVDNVSSSNEAPLARPSVPSSSSSSKSGPLRVKVMGHTLVQDSDGAEYVLYRLRLDQNGRSRDVNKRFSEICEFDSTLSFYEGYEPLLAKLAPKRPWLSFGSNLDPQVTAERQTTIETYMNAVLKRRPLRILPFVQQFLGFTLKRGSKIGADV